MLSSFNRQVLISTLADLVGAAFGRNGKLFTYQLTVQGIGTVSASALIEVSNDDIAWVPFGTMSATGTITGTDYTSPAWGAWTYHRATITAISGTDALATVTGQGA